MAPKGSGRHHPYRATTETQTPAGPRSCSWYAGPGRQPAGDDPPPNRPILVLVDYAALQDLSHASEAHSATCRALRQGNFRYTSAGEYEALFTWAQQYSAEMASAVDIRMIPTDLELPYSDLDGDV